MKRVPYFIFILTLFSCSVPTKRSAEEIDNRPLEVPPSYLSFRVDFSASELENGVNEILPLQLMDNSLPMREKGDTLFLKVVRKGRLKLDVRKDEVYASIPLAIEASVRKKVMGITFSNRDSPVSFEGTLKSKTKIELKDDWGMDFTCEFIGFELAEEPKISLMGLTLSVEKAIEDALKENRDQLSDIICQALDDAIDFRKTVNKVWDDVQKPIRIAKSPRKLWLYSEPLALHGQLIPKERDTLSIHLEYRTIITIRTSFDNNSKPVPLSPKQSTLNTRSAIVAYPSLSIPFEDISQVALGLLKGHEFKYEEYLIQIENVTIGREGQKLKVILETKGDINGTVIVLAKPILGPKKKLQFEGLSYQINAEDEWVKMTDWAIHEFLEEYIAAQLVIDLDPYFKQLDAVIMEGVSAAPLGEKIDLEIGFDKIASHEMKLTDTFLQWVFMVEGSSGLRLKSGVFKKKN